MNFKKLTDSFKIRHKNGLDHYIHSRIDLLSCYVFSSVSWLKIKVKFLNYKSFIIYEEKIHVNFLFNEDKHSVLGILK
jgi:hypothetical protein